MTLRILGTLGGTCECTHCVREFALAFSDNFERLLLVMDVERALLTVRSCICYSIDASHYMLIRYSNVVYSIANFTSDSRLLIIFIIDKLMQVLLLDNVLVMIDVLLLGRCATTRWMGNSSSSLDHHR